MKIVTTYLLYAMLVVHIGIDIAGQHKLNQERKQRSVPVESESYDFVSEPQIDGWVLVRKQGNCRHYIKMLPAQKGYVHRVRWSICGSDSTSVIINTEEAPEFTKRHQ